MPKGAKFNQHGRLLTVQVGAVLTIGLLAVSAPGIPEASNVHETIEALGFAMILMAVAGRLWSILYIGGRKSNELISSGPFSMTRNPLYFFSTVGAVGAGLVFGSILVAASLGVGTYILFRFTADKEAEHLLRIFGPAYSAYAEATPSFWPNIRLYHDLPNWLFSTSALRSTFIDGLFFLAVVPALELFELLRASGVLPTLFRIY